MGCEPYFSPMLERIKAHMRLVDPMFRHTRMVLPSGCVLIQLEVRKSRSRPTPATKSATAPRRSSKTPAISRGKRTIEAPPPQRGCGFDAGCA